MDRRKKNVRRTSPNTPQKKPIKLTPKPDPTVTAYDPGFEAALTDWIGKHKTT